MWTRPTASRELVYPPAAICEITPLAFYSYGTSLPERQVVAP